MFGLGCGDLKFMFEFVVGVDEVVLFEVLKFVGDFVWGIKFEVGEVGEVGEFMFVVELEFELEFLVFVLLFDLSLLMMYVLVVYEIVMFYVKFDMSFIKFGYLWLGYCIMVMVKVDD